MATAIVTGGTGLYILLWDDGSAGNTVSTFTAGYHTLTVTDANNCIFVDSIEIFEPSFSVEIDSLIISAITCNNANNASITVLATGGQLPYVYSSTNGVFTQNNIGFSNLFPNQYIMYVRDSRGCIDRDTVILTQPDSLYIDTTIFSHITCNGANDGAIQAINVVGGTLPYMYSVNGGTPHSNMAYFNGYGPGTYTVQVMDDNNCSAQDIIIITEPDEIDVTITTSMWNGYEIKCNGDNSGWADLTINGGNGPYNKTVYIAGNPTPIYNGSSNNITGLSAGLYTFIVTDNNGCTYQEIITYLEPTPIVHNFIIDHITCTGWTNASITDVVSGGVGSATTYTYLWSTGDVTYSINNIGIGNYTMWATDENNCTTSDVAVVNGNSVLAATVASTQNPTCWNYCDGEISLTVSGGVPNINGAGNAMYNYQWDDDLMQITPTAIGLCVDDVTNSSTFNCTITDALGCTETETVTLTQPEKLEVSIMLINSISCYGGSDGKLKATSVGGNSGTITYNWNTGQIGANLNNINAANYVVVATDPLGCVDTTDYLLDQPELLDANIALTDIQDVSCYGFTDGEITVTVTGGTTNVLNSYTYNWNPGGIGTSTLSSLDTGIYYVEVTDVNGCTTTSNNVYISQPTNPLSIFTDSIDETCMTDGSATVYVLGGTPTYSYLWSPSGQTTAIATALIPNTTYTITVTDANGCVITDETYINGHENIFLPNNDDYLDSIICLGKSVSIEIEDKPFHSYLWSTGETTSSITVTPDVGITVYTLIIIDEINCPNNPFSIEATIHVNQLDINPVATPNPIVKGSDVTITSSYMYNSFIWTWTNNEDSIASDNGQSMTDNPENSKWYYVEATDYEGCKGLDSIYVVVGAVTYDALSPNGDGLNDEWEILDIERYTDADVQIFNRWGTLVFSAKGGDYNDNKWDGTFENKELPVGTYYYTINLNDGSELQSGAVTIVR